MINSNVINHVTKERYGIRKKFNLSAGPDGREEDGTQWKPSGHCGFSFGRTHGGPSERGDRNGHHGDATRRAPRGGHHQRSLPAPFRKPRILAAEQEVEGHARLRCFLSQRNRYRRRSWVLLTTTMRRLTYVTYYVALIGCRSIHPGSVETRPIITAQWTSIRLIFWLELWVWQRQARHVYDMIDITYD